MYNLIRIYKELGTREQCVQFAEDNELIPATKLCSVHKVPKRIMGADKCLGSFICFKGQCRFRSKVARAKGTWFENVKLSMPRVFYLMYAFTRRWNLSMVIFEDPERSLGNWLSEATVCEWYNYCRETVVLYQLDKEQSISKIGGPGKVVLIDESKFGLRKSNKGQHLEGRSILGIVEQGSEDLRLEVCPENICSADVLVSFIQKHVAEGSIIHTANWQAYDCLVSHGYIIHKNANNSDPTNIKCLKPQWRIVKSYFNFKRDNLNNNLGDIIVEYLWRRTAKYNNKDLFLELVNAIKYVYKKK